MAVIALVLYSLWLGLALGARTLVALRRTGDTGLRSPPRSPLTLGWWAAVLSTAALVAGVAAPVASLAGMAPIAESDLLGIVGLIIAVVGVAATFAAQLSMGDSWRVGVDKDERTDLVTGGAFTIVRNPIFTAMVVTAIGLAAMVPNLVAVTGLVALVGGLELQVRGVEEPYLRRVHGADYVHYAQHVGRFLPGVGRLRSTLGSRDRVGR